MAHHCKALIIHCMDFRFGSAIKNYLAENGLLDNCDIVAAAGAAKIFVSPENESDREFLMRQIGLSQKLHTISEVILMNHADCGAYGGRNAFASHEKEIEKHAADLTVAVSLINKEFPSLKIRTLIADIDESGEIKIKTISHADFID